MGVSRSLPVAAAAAVVSVLLVASGWLAAPGHPRAAAASSCAVLQVGNQGAHSTSVVRLTLPSGERRVLSTAGRSISALAYSAEQGVAYGVADRDHAVRIDSTGRVTDLGRRPGAWIVGAIGAAMSGNSWYVLRGNNLYTVDADPSGPGFLTVTGRVQLRPVVLSSGVGDIAYDASSGLLYGVSRGLVVTLDPRDGRVAPVPGPKFPPAPAYGSVVFGPDGALYATADRIGHRSVTYRLPHDGSGSAVEISTGPELAGSDAAGCLAAAPPSVFPEPSAPSPTAPSPTAPSSSVKPSPSQAIPPPRPVVEQPPSVTSSPSATLADPVIPPVSSSPAAKYRPPPTTEPVADKGHQVEKQRQWGLTVLILVVGGGAAAAHVRRGR